MAKAIEEEERNIGVAFILPFTLTCVCVCVCVCVCLCLHHRVYEDRVWLGLFTHEQNRRGKISFFRRVLFSSVLLDFTSNAHITIREREEREEGRT